MQRSIQFSVAADCVAGFGMTLDWVIGLCRKFFLVGCLEKPSHQIPILLEKILEWRQYVTTNATHSWCIES
jgi:hypothetical protein